MTQALQFILDFGLKFFLSSLVYSILTEIFHSLTFNQQRCLFFTSLQFDHLPIPSHLQAFPYYANAIPRSLKANMLFALKQIKPATTLF